MTDERGSPASIAGQQPARQCRASISGLCLQLNQGFVMCDDGTCELAPLPFRMTNAFVVELANERYRNDPEFHARVTLAERATVQRLEAEGMTLSRPYLVAIRMAAMLGLFSAETPVDNNGADHA